MISISLWITMITFFAFLQNFFIRDGFGVYYIRALRGSTLSSLSDTSTIRQSTTETLSLSKASVNSIPAATAEMESQSSDSGPVGDGRALLLPSKKVRAHQLAATTQSSRPLRRQFSRFRPYLTVSYVTMKIY